MLPYIDYSEISSELVLNSCPSYLLEVSNEKGPLVPKWESKYELSVIEYSK